ncbi:MAG: hypothetical protein O2890_03020 [Cyanobacteria bacterium]|nr:hypothetical protein [Cyanobacteriota bacterium]
MPRKINEITKQAIKRDLREGGDKADKKAIAEAHSVSLGTVKRLVKELKAPARKAATQDLISQVFGALEEAGVIDRSDFQRLLLASIQGLTDENARAAPVKSREGASRAAAELMRTYEELFPATMEQAADWLLGLPDFEPMKFAAMLRDRYGKTG